MFSSHRPEIDEPRAVWLAYIVGCLTFGLIVFCVIFVAGFFMYLDSSNTLHSPDYEMADGMFDIVVNDEDPMGSILMMSTVGGILAGLGLFVKHLFELVFPKK